jgi:hypothetical protein
MSANPVDMSLSRLLDRMLALMQVNSFPILAFGILFSDRVFSVMLVEGVCLRRDSKRIEDLFHIMNTSGCVPYVHLEGECFSASP